MDTFDYIIVGAGSAGCLLANRLSADPGARVLLLEAGGRDTNPNIHIPAAFYKLFRQKEDWNFHTTPQPHMKGRPMYQPRGKVLGGSSSINAMIYIRGHRFDYDSWAALGNPGWSYEEVLPYFRKFERNLEFSDEFHGREGELTVSPPVSPHPLSRTLLEAAQQAGYPLNADFNGRRQEGFGFYQLTIRDGRRCSAADAFLRPVAGRPNLSVLTNALVHRLLFEQRRARGLIYEMAGRQIEVAARREIILSAGAFGSPQLLLLSGVGDAGQLRELGIPVLHHLPGVGRNLHDHLLAGVSYHCTQPITMDGADRWPRLAPNLLRYLLNRKGPFASNVAECGGFLRSQEGLEAPDLQFHFAPAYYLRHAFENPRSGHGFGLGPTLIAPHSRGSLRLAGPDPRQAPLIDPGYFSDERDLRTLMRGCEMADQILRQPAFDRFRGPLFMPPRELQEESEVMDYLRQWSETLYHPVGTCRMGADEEAVVDAGLRVHGLQGLRVADASVMPLIVRGNTNAPTMMIAEKAAAQLLAEKVA